MKTRYLTLTAAVISLAACREQAAESAAVPAPATETPAALSAVFSAEPAGEPAAIAAIRATAKPGDTITLQGLIMGSRRPFVDGRAAFLLGDPDVLTPCNEKPGDDCETPWDVCCDSPEDKKRGTATIQIVDADGRVLRDSLEGIGGLVPLARVTVSGTVAEGSNADLLLVNATAIRAFGNE